jgi:hypothetical protein
MKPSSKNLMEKHQLANKNKNTLQNLAGSLSPELAQNWSNKKTYPTPRIISLANESRSRSKPWSLSRIQN